MPLWPCLLILPKRASRAFEPFFTVAFAVCFVPPRLPLPPRPLLYFLPIVYAVVAAVTALQCLSLCDRDTSSAVLQ